MNLLSMLPLVRTKAPRQVVSEQWSDRIKVLESGVNLFCWQRSADDRIHQYLQVLAQRPVFKVKKLINLASFDSDIGKARFVFDPERDESADAFWEDIAMLTHDFLVMLKQKSGTLHLRVLDDDACTKFHLDRYEVRLFTTYFGPGTEWLPEKAVNRTALGKTNELIVKEPSLIRQMQPFEVGLLKGQLSNRKVGSGTPGIVHRSPSIAATGQKRLILRIDCQGF